MQEKEMRNLLNLFALNMMKIMFNDFFFILKTICYFLKKIVFFKWDFPPSIYYIKKIQLNSVVIGVKLDIQ